MWMYFQPTLQRAGSTPWSEGSPFPWSVYKLLRFPKAAMDGPWTQGNLSFSLQCHLPPMTRKIDRCFCAFSMWIAFGRFAKTVGPGGVDSSLPRSLRERSEAGGPFEVYMFGNGPATRPGVLAVLKIIQNLDFQRSKVRGAALQELDAT